MPLTHRFERYDAAGGEAAVNRVVCIHSVWEKRSSHEAATKQASGFLIALRITRTADKLCRSFFALNLFIFKRKT
jgi:hypothetical protein